MRFLPFLAEPLPDAAVHAVLDNRLQLFDIIEKILAETGPAELYVSTFSTSEEFLRRLARLKRAGLVRHAALVIDHKASKKNLILYPFMRAVFDSVHLADNHSKLLLISNDRHKFSVVTSQNQTRGSRYECSLICRLPAVFDNLLITFKDIINHHSISLDDIFSRNNKPGG